MAFGRRGRGAHAGLGDDPDADQAAADAAEVTEHAAPPAAPTGPWDVSDAPEPDGQILDLGALRLSVPEGMQVQLALEGTSVVPSITDGASALQVMVFAAPKSSGIWDEVRAEIIESLRAAGGKANERIGEFGPEIDAVVAMDIPGQGRQMHPAIFVGVDGPRWFCRGLLSGRAVSDRAAAATFWETFRKVVVDRGSTPMAPRDPLPLDLPPDAMAAMGIADATARPLDPRFDTFTPHA
jgi:Protein of unknown function (DUF3710)